MDSLSQLTSDQRSPAISPRLSPVWAARSYSGPRRWRSAVSRNAPSWAGSHAVKRDLSARGRSTPVAGQGPLWELPQLVLLVVLRLAPIPVARTRVAATGNRCNWERDRRTAGPTRRREGGPVAPTCSIGLAEGPPFPRIYTRVAPTVPETPRGAAYIHLLLLAGPLPRSRRPRAAAPPFSPA